MEFVTVDERDIDVENPMPRFRVFFYSDPAGGGTRAVEAVEATGCDVLDVFTWARRDTEGRPFAVGLMDDTKLTWLFGGDPNELSPARPEWVARTLAEGR